MDFSQIKLIVSLDTDSLTEAFRPERRVSGRSVSAIYTCIGNKINSTHAHYCVDLHVVKITWVKA